MIDRLLHVGREQKETDPPSTLYKFYVFIPPIKRYKPDEPYQRVFAFGGGFWPHRCGFGISLTHQYQYLYIWLGVVTFFVTWGRAL